MERLKVISQRSTKLPIGKQVSQRQDYLINVSDYLLTKVRCVTLSGVEGWPEPN